MAVTEADVAWCYQSLLGRDPESPQVVKQKLPLVEDFRSLVKLFVECEEFRQKHSFRTAVPLNCPPMSVEAITSPQEVQLLKDRVRQTWTELGNDRPHHSVLTGPRYLPQLMGETSVESFYESGIHESETIAAMLSRVGFSNSRRKVCVEYGCGLGRVTLALAKAFKVVHGYDISPSHLALAKARARESQVANVKFHLCSADVIVEDLEPCDFLYSRLVFQHNPPPLMRELIAAGLKSLRAGGVGIFQVPTYMTGYSFQSKKYLATARSRDMEMHCLPQSDVLALIAKHRCDLLELREDGSVGHEGRWISNMFVVQRRADRR